MRSIVKTAVIVLIIIAGPANAGGWYGSVGLGAATNQDRVYREYSHKSDGTRITTLQTGGATNIITLARVEIGYRWQVSPRFNITSHYLHISDPFKEGDGIDGLFIGLEF